MVPKKESLMIKIYNIVTVCFFKNAIYCISYRLKNTFSTAFLFYRNKRESGGEYETGSDDETVSVISPYMTGWMYIKPGNLSNSYIRGRGNSSFYSGM